jgi:S-ribosylhomocysteine lyase
MEESNRKPVIDVPPLRTIEHLGAAWIRSNPQWNERIIYFGSMGCRTGFYMLLRGNLELKDVRPLVDEMFQFILDLSGKIPGASPEECGIQLSRDLPMVARESRKCASEVLLNPPEAILVYPG